MLILIDNYDSFTYNLVHYLGELGADIKVYRNDKIDVEAVMAADPEAIVLSPGPCTPNEAGICLDLIQAAAATIPMLGVCLGHQSMGQAFGARVIRAPSLMHGKISPMLHEGQSVFRNLPSPFDATRYHSLTIEPASVPDCLNVTARTEDGIIMGIQHKTYPTHGVQFHPESIASEHGHTMLRNFLQAATDWNKSRRDR